MWSRDRIRKLLRRLLHTNDTPERTSFALALGVALGLSPFYGLHSLVAIALAFALRLNRVAVIAGAWANTPYTVIPIATFGTMLGSLLTGNGWVEVPWPTSAHFKSLDTLWLYMGELRPVAVYFIVGNLALSVVGFIACYSISLPVIRRLRRLHDQRLAALAAEAGRSGAEPAA